MKLCIKFIYTKYLSYNSLQVMVTMLSSLYTFYTLYTVCKKQWLFLLFLESRLTTCQDCFRRSYGDNMERLAGIKGDSSRELALYVRLYLLQGILAFYHQQHNLALTLLNKVRILSMFSKNLTFLRNHWWILHVLIILFIKA